MMRQGSGDIFVLSQVVILRDDAVQPCRVIVSLKKIEYAFGYIIIRSPYTPYSIYLRKTIRV